MAGWMRRWRRRSWESYSRQRKRSPSVAGSGDTRRPDQLVGTSSSSFCVDSAIAAVCTPTRPARTTSARVMTGRPSTGTGSLTLPTMYRPHVQYPAFSTPLPTRGDVAAHEDPVLRRTVFRIWVDPALSVDGVPTMHRLSSVMKNGRPSGSSIRNRLHLGRPDTRFRGLTTMGGHSLVSRSDVAGAPNS